MVMDMARRQPSSDHHDIWLYPSRQNGGRDDARSELYDRHLPRTTVWPGSESSIDNVLGRKGTLRTGDSKTQDDLTPELDGISTIPLATCSSHSSVREEHYDISPSTGRGPKVEAVHENTSGSCPPGQFPSSERGLPLKFTTEDFQHKGLKSSSMNKRGRAFHDVDGPGTSHLSSKKRRLRRELITSRLSQPFSLPATHILNRDTDEDTPVISRFVKLAALGAKKAGHQTTLVRKAAILNRVRLNVRQAAVTRGHDRIWRMTRLAAMSHGLQLVTDSTGAMFPGRSGEQVPGPIVPRAWRPHTTASHSSLPETMVARLPSEPPQAMIEPQPVVVPPPTSIMTPLAGADEDEASFPDSDLDSRYADPSDDDADDVYADFGVLFGGGADASEGGEEDEHYYEEYLDEVDGIIWSS